MGRTHIAPAHVNPGKRGCRAMLPLAFGLCGVGGTCASPDDATVSVAAAISARHKAMPSSPEAQPRRSVMETDTKGRLVIGPGRGEWRSPYVEQPGRAIAFETLERGSCPRELAFEKRVIRDAQAFRRLWIRLRPHSRSAPPPPKLDFTKVMVLYVPMGEKATAHYDVRVQKVIESEREITVLADEYWPGEGCSYRSLQAVIRPYHLVTIVQSSLPVVFAIRIRRYCP